MQLTFTSIIILSHGRRISYSQTIIKALSRFYRKFYSLVDFFSKQNGFDKCIRRIGRKVIIKLSEWEKFIESKNSDININYNRYCFHVSETPSKTGLNVQPIENTNQIQYKNHDKNPVLDLINKLLQRLDNLEMQIEILFEIVNKLKENYEPKN